MSLVHPRPEDPVTKYGYSFTWTDAHLNKEEIEPLRHQHDKMGAAALERIQAIRASIVEKGKWKKGASPPPTDLYSILRDHHRNDVILRRFWDDTHTVPEWVDWEQLARGQKVFYRYAIANIVGFALQGFVAENSASPGVTEVLIRTGGFSTRVLLGRLLPTFQWLIQVTHDLTSIQPTGEGHASTIRVRLLHASVRHRILHLRKTNPSYFNTEKYGIPINTLDSIHSISTFCCNPFFLQLPKFGIRPSPAEIEDYIALFRYLGYLLGTPMSYFTSVEQAKCTMESLLVHELRVTDTSKVVTFNFIECVSNLPFPFHVSRQFIEAGSRWINGDELCDSLEMGRPGVLHYLSFAGYCVLAMGLAWVQWLVPGVDEIVIKFFRDIMDSGIVRRQSRSLFGFEFVPRVRKTTGKERFGGKAMVSSRLDMGLFELGFLVLLFGGVGGLLVGGLGGLINLGMYICGSLW